MANRYLDYPQYLTNRQTALNGPSVLTSSLSDPLGPDIFEKGRQAFENYPSDQRVLERGRLAKEEMDRELSQVGTQEEARRRIDRQAEAELNRQAGLKIVREMEEYNKSQRDLVKQGRAREAGPIFDNPEDYVFAKYGEQRDILDVAMGALSSLGNIATHGITQMADIPKSLMTGTAPTGFTGSKDVETLQMGRLAQMEGNFAKDVAESEAKAASDIYKAQTPKTQAKLDKGSAFISPLQQEILKQDTGFRQDKVDTWMKGGLNSLNQVLATGKELAKGGADLLQNKETPQAQQAAEFLYTSSAEGLASLPVGMGLVAGTGAVAKGVANGLGRVARSYARAGAKLRGATAGDIAMDEAQAALRQRWVTATRNLENAATSPGFVEKAGKVLSAGGEAALDEFLYTVAETAGQAAQGVGSDTGKLAQNYMEELTLQAPGMAVHAAKLAPKIKAALDANPGISRKEFRENVLPRIIAETPEALEYASTIPEIREMAQAINTVGAGPADGMVQFSETPQALNIETTGAGTADNTAEVVEARNQGYEVLPESVVSGYNFPEPGLYEVPAQNIAGKDGGPSISRINPSATASDVYEELIHSIQRKLVDTNPGLASRMDAAAADLENQYEAERATNPDLAPLTVSGHELMARVIMDFVGARPSTGSEVTEFMTVSPDLKREIVKEMGPRFVKQLRDMNQRKVFESEGPSPKPTPDSTPELLFSTGKKASLVGKRRDYARASDKIQDPLGSFTVGWWNAWLNEKLNLKGSEETLTDRMRRAFELSTAQRNPRTQAQKFKADEAREKKEKLRLQAMEAFKEDLTQEGVFGDVTADEAMYRIPEWLESKSSYKVDPNNADERDLLEEGYEEVYKYDTRDDGFVQYEARVGNLPDKFVAGRLEYTKHPLRKGSDIIIVKNADGAEVGRYRPTDTLWVDDVAKYQKETKKSYYTRKQAAEVDKRIEEKGLSPDYTPSEESLAAAEARNPTPPEDSDQEFGPEWDQVVEGSKEAQEFIPDVEMGTQDSRILEGRAMEGKPREAQPAEGQKVPPEMDTSPLARRSDLVMKFGELSPRGKIDEWSRDMISWIDSRFTDMFAYLRQMEQQAPRQHTRSGHMAMRMVPGMVYADITLKLEPRIKEIVDTLAKANIEWSDANDYAYALEAIHRNSQGISAGMTDAEALGIISEQHNKGPETVQALEKVFGKMDIYESGRVRFYHDQPGLLQELNNWKLDNMVASGILSEKGAELWKEKHPYYVPLKSLDKMTERMGLRAVGAFLNIIGRRVKSDRLANYGKKLFDKGEGAPPVQKDLERDVAGKTYKQKKAEGRVTLADMPLAAAFKDAYDQVARTRRAEADKVVVRWLDKNLSPGFIEKLPTLVPVWRADKDGKWVQDFHYIQKDGSLGNKAEGFDQYKPEPGVLKIMVDGKMKQYKADLGNRLAVNVLRAVQQADLVNKNAIVRAATWWNNFRSGMLTRWNPEFPLTNFPRDLQTALTRTYIQHGGKAASSLIRAVPKAFKEAFSYEGSQKLGDTMRKYIRYGGRIDFRAMNDPDKIYKDTQDIFNKLQKKGLSKREGATAVLNWAKNGIETLNTSMDTIVRVSIFKALADNIPSGLEGKRRDEYMRSAAMFARECTVDFNSKGFWTPYLGAFWMFFNPSAQGLKGMIRDLFSENSTVKKRAKTLYLMGAAAGALSYVAGRAFSGDDEETGKGLRESVPTYSEATNAIFPYIWENGVYVGLPLMYGGMGFSMAFGHGMARMLFELTDGAGPLAAFRFAQDMMDGLTATVSPMGEGTGALGKRGALVHAITPTAIRPFYEVGTNTTYWNMQPIVPEPPAWKDFEVPPAYLRTRDVPRWLGNAMEGLNDITGGDPEHPGLVSISPNEMMYWSTILGGANLRNALRISGIPQAVAEGTLEPQDVPVVSKFVKQLPENRAVRFFEKNQEEIERLKAKISRLKATGNAEDKAEANELKIRNAPILSANRGYESLYTQERRRRKREAREDYVYDPKRGTSAEKKEQRKDWARVVNTYVVPFGKEWSKYVDGLPQSGKEREKALGLARSSLISAMIGLRRGGMTEKDREFLRKVAPNLPIPSDPEAQR